LRTAHYYQESEMNKLAIAAVSLVVLTSSGEFADLAQQRATMTDSTTN
jgi:hypothetical protein